jgi:hypothetical protein
MNTTKTYTMQPCQYPKCTESFRRKGGKRYCVIHAATVMQEHNNQRKELHARK